MFSLNDIITYIVYIYMIVYAKRILFWLYNILFRVRKDFITLYGTDSWVLVTGASDGIGKAFCEELAKTGFNIILVARNLEKLNRVAGELQLLNPKIKTKVLVFDFSKKTEISDYIVSFIDGLYDFDISIIINNVGTGYPNKFNDISLTETEDTINLNIIPQSYLMKLFLPILKERKNKRSAIINVSSYGGQFPLPYYSLYSASKVYADFLSRGVGEEEKYSGIDMLSVKPFEVASILSGHETYDGFFVISPTACAKGSLDALGYETWTAGGWAHQIQVGICDWAFSVAPECLAFWIQSMINQGLIDMHRNNKDKYVSKGLKQN